MTAEKKAKELIDKFRPLVSTQENKSLIECAKQSALIVADEILFVLGTPTYFWETRAFWEQVKGKINQL